MLLERRRDERDALARSAQVRSGEAAQNLADAPSDTDRARGSPGH
jgi:hypothetical protein